MFKSLVLGLSLLGLSSVASAAGLFPKVTSDLDLELFLGRWYQVASTEPFFQKDCVCVTADYGLRHDGKVSVTNTCRKGTPDGKLDQVIGSAGTTNNPAKLNVSFGGPQLPFSNYWVIDKAEDYRYAVISSPLRTPVWILSRTPEIAADDLDQIKAKLTADGFTTSSIKPTLQDACTYTAE